ncbi:hypothetical protein CLU81_3222 [Flavobacterium sp. 9]|nr:hypothetical protein CLU81_3222 [Flavobacterium sp. 9]
MLFQNKLKTASRKIGGFFMRHCEERSNLISIFNFEIWNFKLGICFCFEAISSYPFQSFIFLKKKIKGFPLLSGLGSHFHKKIVDLKVISNTNVTLSEVEGHSNCHMGFDFAQPDKQYFHKKILKKNGIYF